MKCKYGIIDKEKEQLFEKLLPDYYMKEDRHADTVATGASNKGRPCAASLR
jgi:hypothetical protein